MNTNIQYLKRYYSKFQASASCLHKGQFLKKRKAEFEHFGVNLNPSYIPFTPSGLKTLLKLFYKRIYIFQEYCNDVIIMLSTWQIFLDINLVILILCQEMYALTYLSFLYSAIPQISKCRFLCNAIIFWINPCNQFFFAFIWSAQT